MIDVAAAIMNVIVADYPVDKDRIYLSGVSSGGTGCWEFAIRNSSVFAAVVPLGSAGTGNSNLRLLLNVPIWAFHSANDDKTPVEGVRKTVQTLARLGGNVHLTEVQIHQHDCWTQAFQVYGVLDWLLSQRRHAVPAGPPPGTVSLSWRTKSTFSGWQWWQLVLEAGVVSVIAIGTTLLLIRIRRARARCNKGIRELPSMDALINQN
jgi:poly(3-hydroxybutyrate) depolymerase